MKTATKRLLRFFYTNVLNVLLSTEKNSNNSYSNIFREIIDKIIKDMND